MRRILLLASLLLFGAGAAWAGPCGTPTQGAIFAYTKAASITTTPANITLATLSGTVYMVQVGAPATNGDLIYVLPASATTTTGVPIAPGTFECFPLTTTIPRTISAVAASGTQAANIVIYGR